MNLKKFFEIEEGSLMDQWKVKEKWNNLNANSPLWYIRLTLWVCIFMNLFFLGTAKKIINLDQLVWVILLIVLINYNDTIKNIESKIKDDRHEKLKRGYFNWKTRQYENLDYRPILKPYLDLWEKFELQRKILKLRAKPKDFGACLNNLFEGD